MFTIGNYIIMGMWIVATIVVSCIIVASNDEDFNCGLVALANAFISIFIGVLVFVYIGWYHTSTASGIRVMKDYRSELSNGIEREVTITAEDGREIFHYEGKIDIESDHEDDYIKFESEEGKRYIIYYGVQDTITIIEK